MSDYAKMSEYASLPQQTDVAVTTFVLTETDTARAIISMAKTVPRTSDKYSKYLELAKRALEEVGERMCTLPIEPTQFDRMNSEAERLRFEMDALTGDQRTE